MRMYQVLKQHAICDLVFGNFFLTDVAYALDILYGLPYCYSTFQQRKLERGYCVLFVVWFNTCMLVTYLQYLAYNSHLQYSLSK